MHREGTDSWPAFKVGVPLSCGKKQGCPSPRPRLHPRNCVSLQSYGRGRENNATCKTYIAANAGCGFSWPTLAGAPSPDSKWIFDPTPGDSIYRWYIRMSVRTLRWPAVAAAATDGLGGPASDPYSA